MAAKIEKRTSTEITNSLGQGFPRGRLFASAGVYGSNLRRLLEGLATEIQRIEGKIADDVYDAFFINEEKDGLLETWETIVGIPDTCFTIIDKTRDERVAQVLAKLRMSYVVTEQDFIDFADILGFTVTIEQAIESGVFPLVLPFILGTLKSLRFTMVVNLETSLKPEGFPLTLPFTLTGDSPNIVVCLFEKLKPANINIVYDYNL